VHDVFVGRINGMLVQPTAQAIEAQRVDKVFDFCNHARVGFVALGSGGRILALWDRHGEYDE
jgi:hypothetical protein